MGWLWDLIEKFFFYELGPITPFGYVFVLTMASYIIYQQWVALQEARQGRPFTIECSAEEVEVLRAWRHTQKMFLEKHFEYRVLLGMFDRESAIQYDALCAQFASLADALAVETDPNKLKLLEDQLVLCSDAITLFVKPLTSITTFNLPSPQSLSQQGSLKPKFLVFTLENRPANDLQFQVSQVSQVSQPSQVSRKNVMDQFLSMDACTYMNKKQYLNQINLSFTLWSLGLSIFFLLIGLVYLMYFRNLAFLVPKSWLTFFVELYSFFSNLVKSNIHVFFFFINLFSLLFFIFLIIFFLNVISLIPYTFAYTSHISLTFTFSTLLLSLINIIGVERLGAFFLKIFLPAGSPVLLSFFLVPIEFTSYNTRVLSLAIRLFANIMSGHILLTIFAQFGVGGILLILIIIVLIMLAVYFLESVISFLQSYVFLTLTSIYLHENIVLIF